MDLKSLKPTKESTLAIGIVSMMVLPFALQTGPLKPVGKFINDHVKCTMNQKEQMYNCK